MKRQVYLYLCLGVTLSLLVSCNSRQPEEPYYNELTALMAEYVPYIAHWLPYETGDDIILTCGKDTLTFSVTSANTLTMVPEQQYTYPYKDCDCVDFHPTACRRSVSLTQAGNAEMLIALEIAGTKTLPWDGVWSCLWQPAPDKCTYQDFHLTGGYGTDANAPAFEGCIPLTDTIRLKATLSTSIDSIYIVRDKGIARILGTDKRSWAVPSDTEP